MGQYIRILIFTFLPLFVAALHVGLMREVRTRERVAGLFLAYILGVSIGLNGIFSFTGHFFLSDSVAASIGWPTGNPFQLEVAFANLALGVLGILSVRAGLGFRLATAIGATIFLLGANVVHLIDLIENGNNAPGNGAFQILSNFVRPALLLGLLMLWARNANSSQAERTVPQVISNEQVNNFYIRHNWRQVLGTGLWMGGCFSISGAIAGYMSGDMALWLGISIVLGLMVGSGLRIVNSYLYQM